LNLTLQPFLFVGQAGGGILFVQGSFLCLGGQAGVNPRNGLPRVTGQDGFLVVDVFGMLADESDFGAKSVIVA